MAQNIQLFGPCEPVHIEQEVASKKIIVEANRALLSFKKDSGIVKKSKWPEDGAEMPQERPKCRKNLGRNDYKNGAEMACNAMIRVRNGLSLFR